MDLHNRPLLDNRADVALFVEPATLGDLQAAVRKGLNVALLGGPGTGKTTLLRQLCRHLRRQHHSVVFVSGEPMRNALELLTSVRSQLAANVETPEELREAAAETVDSHHLRDHARSLAVPAPTPTVVILDAVDTDIADELFGSVRVILWQAPIVWILSSDQGHDRLPLATDGFVDHLIELPAMRHRQIDELLERRLGERADLLPIRAIAYASAGNPRRAIELAREALDHRDELNRLGPNPAPSPAVDPFAAPALLLAEIRALRRPVWSADQELLSRMNWTRNHAVHVLGELETAHLLHSFIDYSPSGDMVKMFTAPDSR